LKKKVFSMFLIFLIICSIVPSMSKGVNAEESPSNVLVNLPTEEPSSNVIVDPSVEEPSSNVIVDPSVEEPSSNVIVDPSVEEPSSNVIVDPSVEEPPSNVIVDNGPGWTYAATKYGDSTNRDGFAGAITSVIVAYLPSGVIYNLVKGFWAGALGFLGFGNYEPDYFKAQIYTKNDRYYSRTKIVYSIYSNSARTKLTDTTTRYHTVLINDWR
jgi:hypothetical protein